MSICHLPPNGIKPFHMAGVIAPVMDRAIDRAANELAV